MWYIFDKNSKCVAMSNQEPDIKDLETREETAVESDLIIQLDKAGLIDGEVVLIPTPEPTAEELKQQRVSALDREYQPQFAELSQALGMATLADNTELIASIKSDYADLKTEYDTKRGEIDG